MRHATDAVVERLGGAGHAGGALAVRVPAWRRADVTREADLIEEVARLWGLDRLPATLPSRRGATGRLAPEQRLRRRAEDALAGAGLHEAIGWSFTAPDVADRLALPPEDPRRAGVPLENPMAEGHSVMRTHAARLPARGGGAQPRPRRRGHPAVRVRRGLPRPRRRPRPATATPPPRPATPGTRGSTRRSRSSARTSARCSPAACGPPPGASPSRRGRASSPPRAILAALLAAPAHPVVGRARARAVPPPGPRRPRAGRRRRPGGRLARGAASRAWPPPGTSAPAAGFELDWGLLVAAAPGVQRYEDLTSFPAVRQDLAVAVPDDVPAARVVEVVRAGRRPAAAQRRGVRRLPRRAGRRRAACRSRWRSSSARPTGR